MFFTDNQRVPASNVDQQSEAPMSGGRGRYNNNRRGGAQGGNNEQVSGSTHTSASAKDNVKMSRGDGDASGAFQVVRVGGHSRGYNKN